MSAVQPGDRIDGWTFVDPTGARGDPDPTGPDPFLSRTARLYIFSGEHLLCCANIDVGGGTRIVGRIRQSWPEVSIVIRADSGPMTLRWCEDHHGITWGLANNDRLTESAEAMTLPVQRHRDTGAGVQGFPVWTSERRVVGKAESKRRQSPIRHLPVAGTWGPAHSTKTSTVRGATWRTA